MVVYVVEDGSTVRGLPDTVSLRNRIASTLDPIRLASEAEIRAAGSRCPAASRRPEFRPSGVKAAFSFHAKGGCTPPGRPAPQGGQNTPRAHARGVFMCVF
jgi:hypothetical protein